jgi:hypothetical protein
MTKVTLVQGCPPVDLLSQVNCIDTTPLGNVQMRGVSHYGLAIYIKKYIKAKEELWKLKYFTMQRYNLQKIL